MTVFVLFACLLLAGALLLILPPLLGAGARQRRAQARQSAMALTVLREQLAELDAELAAGHIDPASHAQSREELERRALEEGEAAAEAAGAADSRPRRGWALGLALGVPALVVAGYLALGELEALDPQNVAGQQGFTQAQVAEMVGALEARLAQEPDSVEGWRMLSRTYLVLQDYAKAEAAYARLDGLVPNDPDVLSDWADVVAIQRGTVAGEAEALAHKALEAAPTHPKALALAGTAAYQRADYAAAAGYWERILAQIPAGEEVARGVRASVDEARAKAGLAPLAADAGGAAPGATLALSGRLEVDGALGAQVAPEDAVFVFVRGDDGGPPLAALRFKGSELPVDFRFDGAPMMGAEFPVPARVVVAARVAKGGDATPRSGDLEGASAPVAADARDVKVVIDRVRD
ncbi:c-type cytochrome biogenesis protein CcmI [Thauera chlorobenzoica]|uniref:Cytochrome c heme lyase subunit CcmH n=1 Tax=Thauera chlorobenzoica TaxID=96773 RepID=A0A1H5YCY1_9RHOO|nr:c-type cytochrome biogenesis protein CcmI [Thauera chlorobenzoica]APR03130.1 Cytochrome c heme lyase subunit CcmH [Thauera chlorobenzoica]SEG21477.1 cytochrome c-type biogenesis protein CcmH [Thauera chlorobenzoica]